MYIHLLAKCQLGDPGDTSAFLRINALLRINAPNPIQRMGSKRAFLAQTSTCVYNLHLQPPLTTVIIFLISPTTTLRARQNAKDQSLWANCLFLAHRYRQNDKIHSNSPRITSSKNPKPPFTPNGISYASRSPIILLFQHQHPKNSSI